jgi:hypothetical protein
MIPLGILATTGGGAAPAYELISSTILSSSQSSISFSSIVGTYKHLQLRYVARTDRGGAFDISLYRLNNDTGANYAFHQLYGDPYSSSVVSANGSGATSMNLGFTAGGTYTNEFSPGVIDILDYASTAKNKTIRALHGNISSGASSQRLYLSSGLWVSTAAVTSIQITSNYSANFVAGSRFSLYGIKGA